MNPYFVLASLILSFVGISLPTSALEISRKIILNPVLSIQWEATKKNQEPEICRDEAGNEYPCPKQK